jgi:hypothetical protein
MLIMCVYVVTQVPTSALTVGVGTVMDAREVLIIITGLHKAFALAQCIERGISHMCVPFSCLLPFLCCAVHQVLVAGSQYALLWGSFALLHMCKQWTGLCPCILLYFKALSVPPVCMWPV